jgi:3-deoxy-D-manno-octulosonic-acid transferase
MRYILNCLYLAAAMLLMPWWVVQAIRSGKVRRGLWTKLTGAAFRREGNGPCIWFHGVSVGEIHLLEHVVAAFRQRHLHWHCVISATTDTGYAEAEKRFGGCTVFWWPLDFSWAVRRALRRVRPDLVVMAEGELWPNFIAAAKRRGVRVVVVNARLSPRSLARHQKLSFLTRSLWSQLDLVAAQTEEYAGNFKALGATNVHVTGSVKYDGAAGDSSNPHTGELRELLAVKPDDLIWIAGSTQAPEEQIVLDIFRRARHLHPRLRLFLVPRQKDRFDEVADLVGHSGLPLLRRSALTGRLQDPQAVVLVDTIGELGALWGLADLAFVGGSLDGKRGGQNMIEPAAYGAAVVFGPHVWNFKESASRLVERRGAIQVQDAAELGKQIEFLLEDSAARASMGDAARRFVQSQHGATQRTIDLLEQLLPACEAKKKAA